MEVLSLGDRPSGEPSVDCGKVEGDGGDDVLEPGLAHSNVAAPPKPEPADCLGQGSLDPGTAGILLSPLHGFLPTPGLLNGLVFGVPAEGKRAGVARGAAATLQGKFLFVVIAPYFEAR